MCLIADWWIAECVAARCYFVAVMIWERQCDGGYRGPQMDVFSVCFCESEQWDWRNDDQSVSVFGLWCSIGNVSDIWVVGGIPFWNWFIVLFAVIRAMCGFCGMRLTASYYVLFQLTWTLFAAVFSLSPFGAFSVCRCPVLSLGLLFSSTADGREICEDIGLCWLYPTAPCWVPIDRSLRWDNLDKIGTIPYELSLWWDNSLWTFRQGQFLSRTT